MNKRVKFRNESNIEMTIPVDFPNKCPCCGNGIEPVQKGAFSFGDILTIFFKCPLCNEGFLSRFSGVKLGVPDYIQSFPTPQDVRVFPESVSKISPEFVEIYNQAFFAEQAGFNLICGMGYRKALEFFVKDFAIHTFPDKESAIAKMTLGKCIDEYVLAENIKSLAKASAWIGNDETHYTRKHPDYSYNDLKAFINAFVSYVDMNYECERAASLVNSEQK